MNRTMGWLALSFSLVVGCGKKEVSSQFGDLAGVQAAAEQGSSDAQFILGDYYFQGKGGVPVDYEKAVRWLGVAAEKGNAEAQVRLGVCYGDGKGVTADSVEELKWYRLAAERGHARAQANLAGCYLIGRGMPQNEVEAYKWFTLAMNGKAAGAEMMRRTISLTPSQVAEREARDFVPHRKIAQAP